jgi:hypothetical protein
MTSQDAKEIAKKWVIDSQGPECAIYSTPLFEDESYFIFHWNAKGYFETGDINDCFFGHGPTVLDKRDGRIFSYGSADGMKPLEEFVEEHRLCHNQESLVRRSFPDYDMRKPYRVFIRKIYNSRRLLKLLESFKLPYVIPEIETDTIWRVAKQYDKKLLRKRLSEAPPIVFGYIGAAGRVEHLSQLLAPEEHRKPCEISIEEYHKQKKTHDPSKAKHEDLEPEW